MLQLFEHSLSFLASLLSSQFLILSSLLLWTNILLWWLFQQLQSRFPLTLLGTFTVEVAVVVVEESSPTVVS